MSITVQCPKGHVLKVKNEFAGKSGLCPHCQSRVNVPMPVLVGQGARISDDEILAVLGTPVRMPPAPAFDEDASATSGGDSIHDATDSGSGVDLLSSSILSKQKKCPQCGHGVSPAFTHCPRCAAPISSGRGPAANKPK